MNDYHYQADKLYFKHKITENQVRGFYTTHIHNSYELIYFLDGDATHVIEDKKYKLKKGDLIIIRPLKHHFIQIDSTSRYERYNILFDSQKHGIDSVGLLPDEVEIINIKGNEIAEDIFRKCALYHKNCSEEDFLKLLTNLLWELFYSFHIFPQSLSQKSNSVSPIISKAVQYINENLFTIRNIKQLSDILFVSESYLFRLFKKELHQTPKQYICEKRLLMAQKMIASGEKPSKVFHLCGFIDYTTFYRNYTRLFGYPPNQTKILD